MAELQPIRSDAIVAADYDRGRAVLTLRYESGGTYEYFDVEPELYEELLAAQPHPWSQLGERVKAHRFRRLG
jgi:hypothetical protein